MEVEVIDDISDAQTVDEIACRAGKDQREGKIEGNGETPGTAHQEIPEIRAGAEGSGDEHPLLPAQHAERRAPVLDQGQRTHPRNERHGSVKGKMTHREVFQELVRGDHRRREQEIDPGMQDQRVSRFSWHFTHNRAEGSALRRVLEMRHLQSSHTPKLPSSIFLSASLSS